VRFGREASHVSDRPHDPRGQDGTYAEDLGEGGIPEELARGFVDRRYGQRRPEEEPVLHCM
jgi:hypothetical protein